MMNGAWAKHRQERRYGALPVVLAVAGTLGSSCIAAPDQRGPGAVPADRKVHSAAPDARRAGVVFPSGRMVSAEIANTPEALARGYMFREKIAADEGMVFVFPAPGVHPFWMKNTLVPLDMIWMDEAYTVIHIETSVPPCRKDPCPNYGPLRKASFVLEVRGGSLAQDRLAIGDRLSITFPRPH